MTESKKTSQTGTKVLKRERREANSLAFYLFAASVPKKLLRMLSCCCCCLMHNEDKLIDDDDNNDNKLKSIEEAEWSHFVATST